MTLPAVALGYFDSFELAEQARQAESLGRFAEAMALFDRAIRHWNPLAAPLDEAGQPQLWWPDYWRGSLTTLGNFPISLYRDRRLPSLPICSLTP